MKSAKNLLVIAAFALLAGCATPSYMLKNDKGQVVRCGGDASASMMGGYIGYSVQKTADEKCVLEWKAQGFQLVQ
jgi:hypothetical protein